MNIDWTWVEKYIHIDPRETMVVLSQDLCVNPNHDQCNIGLCVFDHNVVTGYSDFDFDRIFDIRRPRIGNSPHDDGVISIRKEKLSTFFFLWKLHFLFEYSNRKIPTGYSNRRSNIQIFGYLPQP